MIRVWREFRAARSTLADYRAATAELRAATAGMCAPRQPEPEPEPVTAGGRG